MAESLIIPSSEFIRQAKRLAKKYRSLPDDLEKLQEMLLNNPQSGTDLGNGIHKIRLSVSSKNKGKRGGFRVITYLYVLSEGGKKIYLITIYDKSEFENVSSKYVRQIINGLGL